MEIVRLISLSKTEAAKIRARQKKGTMSTVFDDEDYLCYIKKEYDDWKARRAGRPSLESKRNERED